MSDEPTFPSKPEPVEVVIVAAAEPIPVVVTGNGAPRGTLNGRPDPLGPDPTGAEIKQERRDLHDSSQGRFRIEEPKDRGEGPVVFQVKNDTSTNVLILLSVLHAIKLILVFWILMTVIQNHDVLMRADSQREVIASDLAILKGNLDQGLAQQQVLVKRVDDALHPTRH